MLKGVGLGHRAGLAQAHPPPDRVVLGPPKKSFVPAKGPRAFCTVGPTTNIGCYFQSKMH
jgi:hypothetical protein